MAPVKLPIPRKNNDRAYKTTIPDVFEHYLITKASIITSVKA